ncbi:MAG: GntR family transcriptional regulator [Lachnospiraceae bacterium]|jgi:GntR family transcriptional regulator|nr:GntR family transcriptional regulator [Lachnospiraceae bacterium]
MIVIDYQNRKPIYEQIVEKFQTLIITGAIEPDSQMPSVRSLAVDLSINPNTIQKAYSVLEQEGFIYPVKGRGNFVSGNSDLKMKKQEAFFQSLRQMVYKGKELDVKREIFLQKADEYYKEGANV